MNLYRESYLPGTKRLLVKLFGMAILCGFLVMCQGCGGLEDDQDYDRTDTEVGCIDDCLEPKKTIIPVDCGGGVTCK